MDRTRWDSQLAVKTGDHWKGQLKMEVRTQGLVRERFVSVFVFVFPRHPGHGNREI